MEVQIWAFSLSPPLAAPENKLVPCCILDALAIGLTAHRAYKLRLNYTAGQLYSILHGTSQFFKNGIVMASNGAI